MQSLRLKVEDAPFSVTPEIESAVDARWQEELLKKPLFNGQILIVKHITESEITVQYAQYKYLIAQSVTHVKPLAVSGITRAGEQILIGKRSQSVSSYSGYFETVPSGSVDGVSFLDVLYKEFEEETTLSRHEIHSHKVLGLFYCTKTMVYDIGILLDVNPEIAKGSLSPTREYEMLIWIPFKLMLKHSPMVPLSQELLEVVAKS